MDVLSRTGGDDLKRAKRLADKIFRTQNSAERNKHWRALSPRPLTTWDQQNTQAGGTNAPRATNFKAANYFFFVAFFAAFLGGAFLVAFATAFFTVFFGGAFLAAFFGAFLAELFFTAGCVFLPLDFFVADFFVTDFFAAFLAPFGRAG